MTTTTWRSFRSRERRARWLPLTSSFNCEFHGKKHCCPFPALLKVQCRKAFCWSAIRRQTKISSTLEVLPLAAEIAPTSTTTVSKTGLDLLFNAQTNSVQWLWVKWAQSNLPMAIDLPLTGSTFTRPSILTATANKTPAAHR